MDFVKRPTVAVVHLDHIRHNARQILALLPKGQEVMAVVKANGYGLGSVMTARALGSCGIKKFGVATFEEGLELRKQGISHEIHILDGIMAPLEDYHSNRLYPVIYEMEHLKALNEYLAREQREFSASLKFDTGMGRLGFAPAQVDEVVAMLKRTPELKIVAVMTHLSKADVDNTEHTARQYTLFGKLREILKERGLKNAKYGICNSAAIVDQRFEDFDFVRPGIILYGCYPDPRQHTKIDLKPVVELKTRIFSLKKYQVNSSIGYRGTFVTDRESLIAFLPIGYADGYPRLVSNRGHAIIRGLKAPIVGNISMDLMAIDVTDIKDVELYDDVILIGQDGSEIIRVEDVATWAETISYEIICGLSVRVPRVYEGA
ncbi:MAG: alanine racemase [Deltaproteobacteria bacterium]|nr:alanine racemase [Deltaproteobacteria bacterium]